MSTSSARSSSAANSGTRGGGGGRSTGEERRGASRSEKGARTGVVHIIGRSRVTLLLLRLQVLSGPAWPLRGGESAPGKDLLVPLVVLRPEHPPRARGSLSDVRGVCNLQKRGERWRIHRGRPPCARGRTEEEVPPARRLAAQRGQRRGGTVKFRTCVPPGAVGEGGYRASGRRRTRRGFGTARGDAQPIGATLLAENMPTAQAGPWRRNPAAGTRARSGRAVPRTCERFHFSGQLGELGEPPNHRESDRRHSPTLRP